MNSKLFCIIVAFQFFTSAALHLQHSNDADGEEQCAALTNVEGTHFTIKVGIGTPVQKFDLVADTGSPWVIVEDCKCKAAGYCEEVNKCFDRGRSSSFSQPQVNKTPFQATLQFGSGPIQVEISNENVDIEGTSVQHKMSKGALMMVDHMLSFSGRFEGILGLGMPENLDTIPDSEQNHSDEDVTYADGFLTKSGINRFTICIDDDGNWTGDGALHLGGKPVKEDRFNITKMSMHWQLPLNGAAIGDSEVPVDICNPDNMTKDQDSPCAAIFDSGTTYILGPEEQILKIFDGICDQWDRCKNLHNSMVELEKKVEDVLQEHGIPHDDDLIDIKVMKDKSMLFQHLMNNCSDWYNESVGLTDFPKMSFTVSSGTSSGPSTVLHLDPATFIVSQLVNETEVVYKNVSGMQIPVGYQNTGKKIFTCTPAFGAMDYPTDVNGPAWILGVPAFYAYTVSYDMSAPTPFISFSNRTCDTCSKKKKAQDRKFHHHGVPSPLRKVVGAPHMPKNARRMVL